LRGVTAGPDIAAKIAELVDVWGPADQL